MEAKPGVLCFDVFNVGDDLLAFLIRPPDDVSRFRLSVIFVPNHVSYQVVGDVVFLSPLDLSIFFGVRALCGHHMCHVTRELAPGGYDGGRHDFFLLSLKRVFLCYDTAGSSDDKSL